MSVIKIDIVCALYNKEKYILNFLESFFSLDSSHFNLILVDDGSTDGGADIVSDFISKNNIVNINFIKTENNGVSHARNLGISASLGDYIWFCDPDDVLLESANDILRFIDLNRNVDLFVFSYLIKKVSNSIYSKVIRGNELIDPILFLKNNSRFINDYDHPATDGTIWDKVYKSSVIESLRFNEELNCSEDFDFNLNVYRKVNSLRTSSILIYQYNVYGKATLSSTFTEKIVSDRISVERSFLLYLKSILELDMNLSIKKSIVKSCNLLFKINFKDRDILRFYKNEHSNFNIKIKPFINSREKYMYHMLNLRVFNFINSLRKKITLYTTRN